jgi:endo-1,4-beta-xylanase
MAHNGRLILGSLALVAMMGIATSSALAADAPAPLPPKPIMPGAQVITLWPAGSPQLKPETKGFNEPEKFNYMKNAPDRIESVVNIHNPSIEVHLAPPDKANGCAIIVIAGGGNTTCNVGIEGVEIVHWLNDKGIAAFIERYRLRPYRSKIDALADTQRAFRVVRANAEKWHIDPHRIGAMGFSAGGEQCAYIELNFDEGKPDAADPIERQSCRPDFNVLVYPGWRKAANDQVPANAPPAFITCAGLDDASHARSSVAFYDALFDAKIPVELHIYAHGRHAGGIHPRNGIPFGTWPHRFEEWVADLGMLKSTKPT